LTRLGPLRVGWSLADEPAIRAVSPAGLTADLHQLRELAPTFGVRTLRQSIDRG
jgi:hypothetical protein